MCVFNCALDRDLNQHMKGVYLSVAPPASLTGNRPWLWDLVSPKLTQDSISNMVQNSKQRCSLSGDNKANVMSLVSFNSTDCSLLFQIYQFSTSERNKDILHVLKCAFSSLFHAPRLMFRIYFKGF